MTGPNIIDRLIGVFNPDAGLRRYHSRKLLTRAYEGASQKDGWRPRRAGASANADHAADATVLRARARALVQNSPYIANGLEGLVAASVGTGITPNFMGKHGDKLNALWSQWLPYADADGMLDVYGLQAAADRAMEQDGEVLVRIRTRLPGDKLPVPVQFQLLEIDWLDSSRNGVIDGNQVVNGIEYNAIGQRISYWLFDQHPGDTTGFIARKSSSSRVPSSRIIHYYRQTRPGQGRGITRLASVIARTRDFTLYEDAELQRKNLETRLAVIASGDVTSMSQSESESQEKVRETGELGTLASGSILQVPSGNNITVVEPHVAPGYVEYSKHQLHLIAAGMGVTYEMLTGDVSEVNFSSARIRRLDFQRQIEQKQWLCTIPVLCNAFAQAFVEGCVLGGHIPRPEYIVDWSTPKWDYVDTEKDVKADLLEVAGGLSSISEILRRRGYKRDLVFAEIKKDFEDLQAAGVLDILMMLQAKQAPQPAATEAAAATAKTREQEEVVLRNALQDLRTQVTALIAGRTAAPAAPAMNVNLDVTAAAMEHAITQAAAPYFEKFEATASAVMEREMTNIINVPAQEAPVVNLTVVPAPVNNEVHVPEAQVIVNNTHPTRAIQTVERDANDEITRTVTTYESAP